MAETQGFIAVGKNIIMRPATTPNETTSKAARLGVTGSRVHSWIGLALSLLCLFLAFRHVHFSQVMDALVKTNYLFIFLAFCAHIAATVVTVFRWSLLLRPHEVRFSKLFSIFMIAHLFNTVLPAKLGTVARAYLAGEAENIGKAFVLGSIAVEKVLDSLLIALLGVIVVPFVLLPEWLWQSGLGTGILFLVLFLLMVLAGRYRHRVTSWSQGLLARFHFRSRFDLVQQGSLVLDSFAVLSRPDVRWSLWGWSVVIWSAGALANELTLQAMGIRVPFLTPVVLLVTLQIGSKVPTVPANLGVFHYIAVLTLGLFGVDRTVALGYAFVLHAVVSLAPAVMGGFCLWKWQRDFGGAHFTNLSKRIQGAPQESVS
jgi:uncharacterized protein (TIRG00374 family)